MNTTTLILERYKAGDFTERIHMFLEYPYLRDEFTDIEMNLHNTYLQKGPPKNKDKIVSKAPHLLVSTLTKILSVLFGGGALICFVLFLIFGTAVSIHLSLSPAKGLLMDFCLCVLFFCQHSIMVRPGFKNQIMNLIPEQFMPRVYSITSGVTLITVVFFWQGTGDSFIRLPFWLLCVMGLLFILSMAGFYWGISSLPWIDPLGIRIPKERKRKKWVLKIEGPYKIMRHPLYFFALVMIWSTTDFTRDRLMFNLLWSGWIFFGTRLEEKELANLFGDDYLQYQKHIPMLFPKIKKGEHYGPFL